MDLHRFDTETQELADRISNYSIERLKEDPPTLDGTISPEELLPKLSHVITREGLGPTKALNVFENVVAPYTISTDHPRYLAFVPNAPANAASLFDLIVSASSMFGGTWLEGAGVVAAENQALRFISDMIGLDENSGGVFVSGGTAANLSALLAARFTFRTINPEFEKTRLAIACAPSAHSSVRQAARAMDIDIIDVEGDEFGRLTGSRLKTTLENLPTSDRERIFAVVASAGATNTGRVDDLKDSGKYCRENSIWFHVDGAYGGPAILSEKTKHLFEGVDQADSFVVDPHKWLFSPFDSAALIYRNPELARLAHTQHGEYLEAVTETLEWNPSDYAHHLTRRARGLPLWFTLAVHGTDQIADAITQCIETVNLGAQMVGKAKHVEMAIEPQLSVMLIRRIGWDKSQYERWCKSMLEKEFAFIVPTTYKGETLIRLCIINPLTSVDDIELIVESMT